MEMLTIEIPADLAARIAADPRAKERAIALFLAALRAQIERPVVPPDSPERTPRSPSPDTDTEEIPSSWRGLLSRPVPFLPRAEGGDWSQVEGFDP